MKTLKYWENRSPEKDLRAYLGSKPCQIDWELYEHISCGYLAPNYTGTPLNDENYWVSQNGEAECSFDDGYTSKRYSYMTVASYPDRTYWYLGILPDLTLS